MVRWAKRLSWKQEAWVHQPTCRKHRPNRGQLPVAARSLAPSICLFVRPSSHVTEAEGVRCLGFRHPLPDAGQSEHPEEAFSAPVSDPTPHASKQAER